MAFSFHFFKILRRGGISALRPTDPATALSPEQLARLCRPELARFVGAEFAGRGGALDVEPLRLPSPGNV